jgi:aldose sugar dehydrogenase
MRRSEIWRGAVALGLAGMVALSGQTVFAQRKNGVGVTVGGAPPPEVAPVEGKVLETRPPVGIGQKPAFAGQTRAVAVVTKTPYEVKVVTDGLIQPWGMAFLPDGKILVTEKPGAMRVIEMKTGKILKSVQGLPQVKYGGDAGMLDVVLDPKFETNRMIYFTYIEPRGIVTGPQQENGLSVAKAKLAEDCGSVGDVSVILRVEPSIPGLAHYGSRLLFDKEGFLFVSTSERFYYPERGLAQSLFSLLGKILRIDKDGKPAPDNPFDRDHEYVDHPRAEIWALGLRNPQGIAINPATGDLWESEHGPQGGDELNLIERGKNYGWPVIAYGANYDGSRIDGSLGVEDGVLKGKVTDGVSLTAMDGMEQPRYYWDPVIATSGMTFYDGKLIPEWKGNIFVAGLAGQHVSRLVMDGNKVVAEERLLLTQHQRMRDVQEGSDGALWVITDDAEGRLIRISPK